MLHDDYWSAIMSCLSRTVFLRERIGATGLAQEKNRSAMDEQEEEASLRSISASCLAMQTRRFSRSTMHAGLAVPQWTGIVLKPRKMLRPL